MGLKEDLEDWLRGYSRLVILGVGNPLRGDDALGVRIIRELRGKVPRGVRLIEGGIMPENFIGKIRRFRPSHILLIDAARFGGRVGDARLIKPEHISGVAISTHSMPLSILIELICAGTKAKIALLGIEPKNTDFGEEVSLEVREAIKGSAKLIAEVLSQLGGG
ncbi:MAG: hydrogenase maturation peptidase HycI [Candidatus Bathyarchaeia archaeon]